MILNNERIQEAIAEIKSEYIESNSNKPWIIGFSGGKDSTAVLTLVWRALEEIIQSGYELPLRRPVYVVCNDTLVENPIILNYVDEVLDKIEIAAREQNLPIYVRKTTPRLEESFWVNIIGKGYPVPNNTFRWCTDKLKVRPTSKFISEQVSEYGEAIILIGTRLSESISRSKSIKKHSSGLRLSQHPNSANTYVFSPIKNLLLGDVWNLLQSKEYPSPWGSDNSSLYKIYSDANADDYECPTMVTDKEHTSCGQSRFGCWTCTVVKEDKSMSALIKNGEHWMAPLLKFRNELQEERNNPENRSKYRRNGQEAVNEMGAYSAEYRAYILKRLLEVQKIIQKLKPHLNLISNQELIAIQVIWYRDGIFDHKVGSIYRDVFGKHLSDVSNISNLNKEKKLLKEICESEKDEFDLINDLLLLQENKSLLMNKHGLINDFDKRFDQYIKSKN